MEQVCFESLFNSLCQNLKVTHNLEVISRKFSKLITDRDRIHFLLQLDAVQDHLQLPSNCQTIAANGEKSCKMSDKSRNEGNQYFKANDYMTALHKYTESLSYAPLLENEAGSNSVAVLSASLAFANRSAVLFHLGKYQLCLDDISNAFSMRYPSNIAYKLYDRKGQCLMALGRPEQAVLSFSDALNALADCELGNSKCQQLKCDLGKRIQSCDCEQASANSHASSSIGVCKTCSDAPKIPHCQRNTIFESLTDACEVACDDLRGRYIVAKRDIMPGDIILSEKPYASVLLPDSRLDHCGQCYKFTLAPIPCLSCRHCLYCSVDCRNLAQKLYHTVECRLGEILERSGVDKFARLALRTLVMTSLNGVRKSCELLDCGKVGVVNSSSGACNDGVYRADSYKAICSLVTHAEHRTAHDLFRRGAIAIFLLRCLCFVGFFETKRPSDEILSGAGGLLLSHLQSFPCNAHEISEFDLDPDAVATSTPHELGAGIYATLSLFNHSCDPAVTRNFYNDLCIVRAIRSVRASEELSDNYGAVFAMQSRQERHEKLLPQYFFECKCTACVEDWPLFSTLRDTGPHWRCSHCSAALPQHNTKCVHCGSELNLREHANRLRKSDATFKNAFDKLLNCQIEEALPGLLSHLRVMDEVLCPPCADYGACQEAVKQCFSIMANCRYIK